MMLSATRVAALVAVLALGGSLALVAGPLAPADEAPVGAGADTPDPPMARRFFGTGMVRMIEPGEEVEIDGVPYLVDNLSEMPAEWKEVSDPRAGGTSTFWQMAANYAGLGPTWGRFRIEDEEGAWDGDVSGFATLSGSTEFSGWLTGEDAYEGLIMYHRVEFRQLDDVSFDGIIYPASAPPLEMALELTD